MENSTGVGGSTISLIRLVKGLQAGAYKPFVVFYRPNAYLPKFAELGIETTVMSDDRGITSRGPASLAVSRVGGVASLTRGYRRLLRKDLPEAFRLRDLIKRRGAYLVHINGRLSSCRGAILATRLAQVPCVCHVRDFYSFSSLDRWFAKWVDLFLYISKAVQTHTEAALPWARGQLIYDGVNHLEFQKSPAVSTVRDEFGLSEWDQVVGNVGRLVSWKGQHIFLEALSRVAGEFPRLKAVVAGEPDPPADQSYLQRLIDLTRDLGLKGRVVFAGFVEDVPRLLVSLDVLVHSSTRPEPFGLTILEGMAAGLPVVATAAGGALDLVHDGKTGRLVPPGDALSMSEAIRQILSNRADASRMGEAARKHVAQHFSVKQFAEGIEQAYSSVLP